MRGLRSMSVYVHSVERRDLPGAGPQGQRGAPLPNGLCECTLRESDVLPLLLFTVSVHIRT